MFDLDLFIQEKIIKRNTSILSEDIEKNKHKLYDKVNGKTMLVIGGAGSIGSSFIKAVLKYKPASLVVVDINENALAELTRDLRSTKDMYIPKDFVTYPMDFSSDVFKKMFVNRGGFDIVSNFSAHKHVRSEKDIYSIEAMIKNNIINAKSLLDLLIKFPPQDFFCVSTDKAANPTNMMGASKRILEDLIFSYSKYFPVKTARFANVAFSNGSLPAGFLERIQKQQPLSAPSDVQRYFVSPEESGQICMLACLLGNNREIFFPKFKTSQAVTFDFIATELLQEYGYKVMRCNSDIEAIEMAVNLKKGNKNYPVHYSISNTDGEKTIEEFYTTEERIDFNRLNGLGVIIDKEIPSEMQINILIDNLSSAFNNEKVTKEDIVDIITEYLPNFAHIERGKSLDSKM